MLTVSLVLGMPQILMGQGLAKRGAVGVKHHSSYVCMLLFVCLISHVSINIHFGCGFFFIQGIMPANTQNKPVGYTCKSHRRGTWVLKVYLATSPLVVRN